MATETGTATDWEDLLTKLKDFLEGTKATGTLTLTGNAQDTETVTIDSKVYTFQDTLTNVDGNVHIGTTASDTLDNLIAAITLGSGSGTDYATDMTEHPTVTASAGAGDTVDLEAKERGVAENSIATTETLTNGSFGDATLTGGTGAGWTIDEYTVKTDSIELYAKAPGLSVSTGDETYVHIRSVKDTLNSVYNWECRGAVDYDSSIPTATRFSMQPGKSPAVFVRLRSTSMPYWFFVNDRRLIVIAKAGTSYRALYAGLFNAYATPSQYSYPYYIGADASDSGTEAQNDAAIRGFFDPGANAAWFRSAAGVWRSVINHDQSSTETDDPIQGSINVIGTPEDPRYEYDSFNAPDKAFILPWSNGFHSNGTDYKEGKPSLLYPRLRPAPGNAYQLTQAELFTYLDGGLLGALEGVFHISGFGGITAEQSITAGGDGYLIFPNINRSEFNHWCAIKDE